MFRRFALAVALLVYCALPGSAQPGGGKPPEKKGPLDQIDGYKRHTIEGFTLIVSKETLAVDASKYKRPPLEVLELELKTIVRIMPPKSVEALRKMLTWVEWDEKASMPNGRGGNALAVYSGGHQEQLYREGKHPLKAQAVTVLRMKSLTEEHQPGRDSGRCVLLHEFAHAVHDLVMGWESPALKIAYRQAMERKLFDKDQYVSTNEAEFFAELSCAYYDQLHYYPHSRDELKQHDPVTFRLMEATWGKDAKRVEVAKPKTLAEANGADEFDLSVSPAKLIIGESLAGPATTAKGREGKVLVIGFFGGSDKAVLARYTAIHTELAPHGAQVIVGPAYVASEETVKREAETRELPFTVTGPLLVPQKGGGARSESPAHTLVFDAAGKCVFRGSGHQAAPHARAAVWTALLEKAPLPDDVKALSGVTAAAKLGAPFADLLTKTVAVALSGDPKVSAPAKAFLAELTAPGKALLDEATASVKADPVAAYLMAEPLPAQYKGTKLAGQADALLQQWKAIPAVAAELRAHTLLDQLRKIDTAVMASPGSFDLHATSFQQSHAAAINQMRGLLDQLKKRHPNTKSTATAEKVVGKYAN